MSDSLRPHGLQPLRLLCPWDFPGKSTGVGCHCLLRSPLLSLAQTWASISVLIDPVLAGILLHQFRVNPYLQYLIKFPCLHQAPE